MSASDSDAVGLDRAAGHAELERLRSLIGPDEQSYAALAHDVEMAREAARQAEANAGELRGTVVELHVEIDRLRQRCRQLDRNVQPSLPSRLNQGARRRARPVVAVVRRWMSRR